ncbi:MAG TPA: ABC transporter permease [Gaiellaceae bacterium]|nr:ABC transporter permease [Gaiellaceae bacterium]
MSTLRVALVGGAISFRGLFGWLHPAIFVPTLIVPPIFQVLFFAYLGRAAGLESDTFYVVGNSIQLAALPGLFAMSHAINGERRSQTLAPLLASPASRVALFLGRSLPVMAIGLLVSAVSFSFGVLLLDVELPTRALPTLALAMLAATFSCTALGIAHAAVGLRVREMAVFSNLVFAVLLVFCGVNVPLGDLPSWMSGAAEGLPVTHAVQAGREVVAGSSFLSVAHLLVIELAIGAAYLAAGLVLLRLFERDARRRATIELF